MHFTYRTSVFAILLTALAGCGGNGGGGGGESTGRMNLFLTDARSAFENVTAVYVEFTGITLKPQNGSEIFFDFSSDPKSIELIHLNGGVVTPLLADQELPPGRYNWIGLHVNARFDGTFDSYAALGDPMDSNWVELQVPNTSQNPNSDQPDIRLVSGFTVMAGNTTDIVIDWDLRQALVDPQSATIPGSGGYSGYFLRPALRVTDMAAFATLFGTVNEALLSTPADAQPGDPVCTNDLENDTGSAVYVYVGQPAQPGDMGSEESGPLVTATVSKNQDMIYTFEAHFLPVGEYTAALTCQASDDGSEPGDEIWFRELRTFSIEDHGVDAEVHFAPAP